MPKFPKINSDLKSFFLSKAGATITFFVFLEFYCILNFFRGSNSLIRYVQLNKEKTYYAKEMEKLKEEKTQMQNRIGLLNNKTIDLDYLEELARKEGGYSRPNEKVIVYKS